MSMEFEPVSTKHLLKLNKFFSPKEVRLRQVLLYVSYWLVFPCILYVAVFYEK